MFLCYLLYPADTLYILSCDGIFKTLWLLSLYLSLLYFPYSRFSFNVLLVNTFYLCSQILCIFYFCLFLHVCKMLRGLWAPGTLWSVLLLSFNISSSSSSSSSRSSSSSNLERSVLQPTYALLLGTGQYMLYYVVHPFRCHYYQF